MTLSELVVHPYFLHLTEKQRTFVKEFCANGANKVAAAHASHQCKNDKSAISIANKLLKNESVKQLTDAFFGVTPENEQFSKSEFLAFISKKLRNDKTTDGATCKLAELYADIQNWRTKPKEADSPEDGEKSKQQSLTDLVQQMEKSKKEKL